MTQHEKKRMDPVAQLPHAMWQQIVLYLTGDYLALVPRTRTGSTAFLRRVLPTCAFQWLQMVSRAWKSSIWRLEEGFWQQKRQLMEDYDEDRVQKSIDPIIDIEIALMHAVDINKTAHWDQLQRLDLSHASSNVAILVLEVIAMHSRQLQALILPSIEDQHHTQALAVLAQAMVRSHGNMKQLAVAAPIQLNYSSDAFVSKLASNCPRVELLDGWKLTYRHRTHLVYSTDQWNVSLPVWQQFCNACVWLREFNWMLVPFTDVYLQAFARTPKPQLDTLWIHFNGESQFPIADGAYSPNGLIALLQSLPALEVFDMELPFFIDANAVMNDAVLAAISRSCPNLRILRLRLSSLWWKKHHFHHITISGLMQLTKPTALEEIEIHGLIHITPHDLSHWLQSLAGSARPLCVRLVDLLPVLSVISDPSATNIELSIPTMQSIAPSSCPLKQYLTSLYPLL